MTQLTRGQNQPWPHAVATVLVTGAQVGAVLLGADNRAVDAGAWVDATRPARDGVALVGGGVRVDLARVPDVVRRVVVVASSLTGAPTARVLGDGDVEQVTFAPGPPGVETALLVVELYRRDGAWKVRAVGQGYAGGLAELASVHGLAPVAAAPQTAAAAPAGTPDPVTRIGMILDDASRSTAAFDSSASWAEQRLHADLEAVVGDPSLRTGPGGDAARAAAQRRHDDLVAEARTRHVADLRQLRAELAELERSLPASLAGWAAPGWQGAGPADAPWALRLGELGLPGDPDFRIPMVRVLPMQPSLWVETDLGGETTARRMMAALSQRVVLALPHPPTITVVDLGPGAVEAWAGVDVSPVTDPGAASQVLTEHVAHLSVVSLALETGDFDGLPPEHRPGRLLVVCDVPTGLDEVAVTALHTLVVHGAAHGVNVVLSGTTAPGLDISVLTALQELSLRVPSTTGGDLVDRYAGIAWVFHPDPGPDDPRLAEQVRTVVAQRRWL